MSFKKNKVAQMIQVQKPAQQTKLFVATPMYGGMCTGMYSSAIMQTVGVCGQNNIQMYYSFMMNESLITRARNSMAYDFMESEATHLMFIDADIAFNPNDIPRMVAADKDIICGIYPKKEINWVQVTEAVKAGVPPDQLHLHTGAFVLNLAHGEHTKTGNVNEPIEIANGGTGAISAANAPGATGATLISRPSVFSRLLTSPMIQLATSLGWPHALAVASK